MRWMKKRKRIGFQKKKKIKNIYIKKKKKDPVFPTFLFILFFLFFFIFLFFYFFLFQFKTTLSQKIGKHCQPEKKKKKNLHEIPLMSKDVLIFLFITSYVARELLI